MEEPKNDVTSESSGSAKPSLNSTNSNGPKRYSHKAEPQLRSDDQSNSTASSFSPNDTPELEPCKSEFQLRMEQRRSEIMLQRQKLKELQHVAFHRQLTAQHTKFKRLYDVWEEFATNPNGSTMDIDGLTQALAVFGMIIDSNRDFQRHIFDKFDLDGENEITYNDFSATIASFVGSNTDDDSLQTLFEIFDIDQDGYLEIEDMARILLAQNQIAVVVTGQQSNVSYTKRQCIKQARRMFSDTSKISFSEYKHMMQHRTEDDMMIDHMPAPSISMNVSDELCDIAPRQSEIPRFR
eukprot:113568_1